MNTQSAVAERLAKKHPNNYSLSTSENTHCVLGHTVYGFVETEDEKLMYCTDKAGHLRLVKRDILNPTYKSVRQQPKNCVIQITADGLYKGKYVLRQLCDGFLDLTDNIEEAHTSCDYYAKQIVSRLLHNAQYCYGGKFEIVNLK